MIGLDSTPVAAMAILGAAGALLPVLGIARGERGPGALYGAIALGAIAAAGVVVAAGLASAGPPGAHAPGVLADDALGGVFAVAMLLVAGMTAVGSFNYMRRHGHHAVYYSLVLMSAAGMVLVAYSSDLVMLFVAWELMSIPTYVLVGFAKRDPSSNEAAIKYFLFGALASAVIVYGISVAYGLTGSTNIAEVAAGLGALGPESAPLALLAVAMLVAGFGFKVGIVPFHMWLPDAYEGAPAPVAALLAAGTKKAGFAALIRTVVVGAAALGADWSAVLAGLAVMTMTVGNVAAVMQRSLSRMLAYSSIGHAGYILIGLAVAPHSAAGLPGSLLHVLNHAVMKGAAFIAVAGVAIALATTRVGGLAGLARRMPVTALGLVISMMALAGVPPLSGFWSKLVLFGAAVDAGSSVWWGPWLAAAAVLNSALSLAYYGWVVRKMYFEGESERRVREPRSVLAVVAFSVAFMVGFGVYPEPLIQLAQSAAPTVLAP